MITSLYTLCIEQLLTVNGETGDATMGQWL
jgi:hypothetical protein